MVFLIGRKKEEAWGQPPAFVFVTAQWPLSPTPRQSELHALKNIHAVAISSGIGRLD